VIDQHVGLPQYESYPTYKALIAGSLLSMKFESGVPVESFGFVGCLHRYAELQGSRLTYEIRKQVVATQFGPADVVLIRMPSGK
jgi:hypothetical protein